MHTNITERNNHWVWTSNRLPQDGRQVEGLLPSGDIAIMICVAKHWQFTNRELATDDCIPLLWRYAPQPSKTTDILVIYFTADKLLKYKDAIEKCRDANLYITAKTNGLNVRYALRCRGKCNLSCFWAIFNEGSRI